MFALIIFSLVVALLAGAGQHPESAAPVGQILIYTPTPGPDGRIIYIVKPNDTLLSIALLTGLTVEELRELNNLTTDTIFENQELLLGYGGPLEVRLPQALRQHPDYENRAPALPLNGLFISMTRSPERRTLIMK